MNLKGALRALAVRVAKQDYFQSDNEGHIWVKLYMPMIEAEDRPNELVINKGDAVCQGIIVPYYQFINEEPPEKQRNGGFGSTTK